MSGGAAVFEWGKGEDVGYLSCLDAVGNETGGVLDEVWVLQGVEGEPEGLVVEEVDVGVQEHDDAMFSVMPVDEGGSPLPCLLLRAGGAC